MTHKKHQIGVVSEQAITRRGLKICQKGDQIKALTENRWDVASQSTDGIGCRLMAKLQPVSVHITSREKM